MAVLTGMTVVCPRCAGDIRIQVEVTREVPAGDHVTVFISGRIEPAHECTEPIR